MSYPPFYAPDILEISTRGGTLKYDVTVSHTFLDRNDDYYLLSLLIRLRFIASSSRAGGDLLLSGRALSRAIYTLVHARAVCTIRAYIRYLIFMKSKCRLVDTPRSCHAVSAINSQPARYDEAGRCRANGNKTRKSVRRE